MISCYDVPEDFIVVPPDAGFPVDATSCAIARAQSVLSLLMNQFDGSDGDRLSDHVICNALWSVQGDLRMLKTMIDSSYQLMALEDAE